MANGTMNLVFKLTTNSKDFDNSLKNAKSSLQNFDSNTALMGKNFTNVMGKMTKALGTLGIAFAAKDIFMGFINSTESMHDTFANNIGAMSDAWKAFQFRINNGNFNGFKELIEYATQARWALDSLGDAAALFNLDYSESSAEMTELLSTIQKKKKGGEDYSKEIGQYNTLLENLRKDTEYTNEMSQQSLEALFGKHGVNLKAAGMTAMEAARAARSVASGQNEDVNRLNAAYMKSTDEAIKNGGYNVYNIVKSMGETDNNAVDDLRAEWGEEKFAYVQLMRTLGNITTEEKEQIEKILTETSARKRTIAEAERRLNRYLTEEDIKADSGNSVPSSKVTKAAAPSAPTMDVNQLAQYIWNNKTIDSVPYTDLGIPAEDIVEPGTDQIIERVNEQLEEERKRMEALAETTKMGVTAMNAFGSALGYIGSMSGDSTFAKITSSLGSVISQAAATVSSMMSLAGAETIEGLAETFSKAPVGTKIALTATALGGILGMISSVKSAFAGSFAEGGVVPGSSYTGDKLIARVNSGERILTSRQWYDLVNAISMMESYREEVSNAVDEHAAKARISANAIPIAKSNENRGVRLLSAAESGVMRINSNAFHDAKAQDRNVRFVIEGSQLRGVLDNYDKINKL